MASPSGVLSPLDTHNRVLLANVHPDDWVNPTPAGRYHLVVVGAGTAGLIAASFAAGAGARVALVERELMGGDCLNVGCVPSKSILRSSRFFAEQRAAAALGWTASRATPDFASVMERMRRIRARISPHDSAARYRDEKGIDVFLGEGTFTGETTLEVAGETLRFRRAVVASGARAARLPIPGLEDAGYLTNATVFNLTECPDRLAVIGGGPIGAELAQAFQRLGAQVTLLEMSPRLLPREDPDAAAIVQAELERDGVRLVLGATIQRVELDGDERRVFLATDRGDEIVSVNRILVAAGRRPNTEGLGLETAGVNHDQRGITVDDTLQTSNSRIYAAGDVCMAWQFTHAAEDAAHIAVQNALFPGRRRLSTLTMPWCTYTDPEVAHVGLSAQQAETQGVRVTTYTQPWQTVDRALTDGEDEGFVRIHTRHGTDEILGATIVARHAGEMISEVTLAMVAKLGLSTLSGVIHPYPTQSDAIRRTAFQYSVGRVTPLVKQLLGLWFRLTQ